MSGSVSPMCSRGSGALQALSKYFMNCLNSTSWPVSWYRHLPDTAQSGRYFEMLGLWQHVAHPGLSLCLWASATTDWHPSEWDFLLGTGCFPVTVGSPSNHQFRDVLCLVYFINNYINYNNILVWYYQRPNILSWQICALNIVIVSVSIVIEETVKMFNILFSNLN